MPEQDEASQEEFFDVEIKRKFLRVTSAMHLDWPQHGFVLQAAHTGLFNDFAQPEDLPEAVVPKLMGFVRSGHVKFFVATHLEGESEPTFQDVTPTAEDMADDAE